MTDLYAPNTIDDFFALLAERYQNFPKRLKQCADFVARQSGPPCRFHSCGAFCRRGRAALGLYAVLPGAWFFRLFANAAALPR